MELGSRNEAVQARRGGVLERADEASVVVVLIVITVAERVVLLTTPLMIRTPSKPRIGTSKPAHQRASERVYQLLGVCLVTLQVTSL